MTPDAVSGGAGEGTFKVGSVVALVAAVGAVFAGPAFLDGPGLAGVAGIFTVAV